MTLKYKKLANDVERCFGLVETEVINQLALADPVFPQLIMTPIDAEAQRTRQRRDLLENREERRVEDLQEAKAEGEGSAQDAKIHRISGLGYVQIQR